MTLNVKNRKFKVEFKQGKKKRTTTCTMDGPRVHVEMKAFCCPADDFDTRTGRKVAFAKVMKTFPRHQREPFWREAFANSPFQEPFSV